MPSTRWALASTLESCAAYGWRTSTFQRQTTTTPTLRKHRKPWSRRLLVCTDDSHVPVSRNHPPAPTAPAALVAPDLGSEHATAEARLVGPLAHAGADAHHAHQLALELAANALDLLSLVPGSQLRRRRMFVFVPKLVEEQGRHRHRSAGRRRVVDGRGSSRGGSRRRDGRERPVRRGRRLGISVSGVLGVAVDLHFNVSRQGSPLRGRI